MQALYRILAHPCNWVGLAVATAVLLLQAAGLLGTLGLPVALGGYAAGFVLTGLWTGFPRLAPPAYEQELEFSDDGSAREAMGRALRGVRGIVELNPEKRLPASLQAKVLELCKMLEDLLAQWERSKGALSLQESFHARHIAISYLPDALKTYLSIPAAYASTRKIANGKTAVEIFRETLVELEGKVAQLADDLAGQDAHAFLAHSQFVYDKFGRTGPALEAPAVAAGAADRDRDRDRDRDISP